MVKYEFDDLVHVSVEDLLKTMALEWITMCRHLTAGQVDAMVLRGMTAAGAAAEAARTWSLSEPMPNDPLKRSHMELNGYGMRELEGAMGEFLRRRADRALICC